jgi:hypothetical protein
VIVRIFIPIPSSPVALWDGTDISNFNTSFSLTDEIAKLILVSKERSANP